MPYRYEFDVQHRILLAVVYDRIDEHELGHLYADIRRQKDENHFLTGIMTLARVTAFDVSSQFIRQLAMSRPIFEDPILRAVVAPTDLLFGMARMFQIIGSEARQQLLIVRKLDEALTALGAANARFRPMSGELNPVRCDPLPYLY